MRSSETSQKDKIIGARSGCNWRTADGDNLRLRPIASDDIERVAAFLAGLSAGARYFRFGRVDIQFPPAEVAAMCNQNAAVCRRFVAVTDQDGVEIVIALGDVETQADGETCEFTILVAESWRRTRVAHRLMRVLAESAKHSGLKTIVIRVLATNTPMLKFALRHGFVLSADGQHPAIRKLCLSLVERV